MNIIIFAMLTLIYIVSIVAISLKLRDIIKKPNKYEEKELEERAYRLMKKKKPILFFKTLSHQYSFVCLLFWLVLTLISGVLIYAILYFISWNNELIFPGTAFIGVLGMIFLNIIVGMAIIPLHIKNTFFAVAVDDMFNGNRYSIWKKSYISLLIFFILTFPFFALSSNNYIFYNDEGITNSAYFQINETYTAYEDIEEIWVSVNYNKSEEPTSLNYEIKLSNDKILNICTSNYFDKKTLDVHKKIELKSNCKINVENLTEKDVLYLQEKLPKEQIDTIKYIFEGLH